MTDRSTYILDACYLAAAVRVSQAIALASGNVFDPYDDQRLQHALDHAVRVAAIDVRSQQPVGPVPFGHEDWLRHTYNACYDALLEE